MKKIKVKNGLKKKSLRDIIRVDLILPMNNNSYIFRFKFKLWVKYVFGLSSFSEIWN